MRPVPVPTSSTARRGASPTIASIAASTSSSGACRERMRSQSAAMSANGVALRPRRRDAEGEQAEKRRGNDLHL